MKGQMHQTKDVANPERRARLQFYMHNVALMAKNEDMSAKNYNRLKAAEEGEEINWAAIYVENLWKRAAIAVERGGPTVVHAHLLRRALALATQKDAEAKKGAGSSKKESHQTQKENEAARQKRKAPEQTAGPEKDEAPPSFKQMGNLEEEDLFEPLEGLISKRRRRKPPAVQEQQQHQQQEQQQQQQQEQQQQQQQEQQQQQ